MSSGPDARIQLELISLKNFHWISETILLPELNSLIWWLWRRLVCLDRDARWIYSELWLKQLIVRLSKQTVSQPLSKLTVSEVYLYEFVEKDATLGIECYGLSSTVVYVWLSLLCFGICYAMLEICRQTRSSPTVVKWYEKPKIPDSKAMPRAFTRSAPM